MSRKRALDEDKFQLQPYVANAHDFYDTTEVTRLKMITKQNREREEFHLTPDQEKVLCRILDATDTLLVTGEAGTGKTYTQLASIQTLEDREVNVFRLGPTHGSIANRPQDSMTYHAFFGMKVATDYLDPALQRQHVKSMAEASKRHAFVQRAMHRKEKSVVVIEEASMIPAEVVDLFFLALDSIAKGKIRFVFFFDLFQLAPVSGKLFVESRFTNGAEVCFLSRNMRQLAKEDDFLDLLRALSKGELEAHHYQILKSRMRPCQPERRLCARNVTVDKHNDSHLLNLPSPTLTFLSYDKCVKKNPDMATAKSSRELRWAVGAKIVMESSLHEVGLYNGMTGIIIDTVETNQDFPLPVIYFPFYDIKVVVHPCKEEILTETAAPTVQAERTQFPFSIAEATTVHKVQGQTLTTPVEVDFASMDAPGQVYTALSRLTKLEHLFVKNLPPEEFHGGLRCARVNPLALAWFRSRLG